MYIFCYLTFSITIVNWTFVYLSFRLPSQANKQRLFTNMEKEAKESKDLRVDISSVDQVSKVRLINKTKLSRFSF